MKYPIGIQDFASIVQGGYVYVDKTDLVYRLAHEGKVYFLSRPRRFGKSLLLSTLKHYFFGHRELFRGLAIEQLEQEWAEYPVLHLTFAGCNFSRPDELQNALEDAVARAEQMWGKNAAARTLSDRFRSALRAAHQQTGRRVVVLIDEYDKPLLDILDQPLYVTDAAGNRHRLDDFNREALRGFYGVFKDADEDLQFVMLTGVTKFSQVSVFSGFNQPNDISMSAKYEALCGITEEELLRHFAPSIDELAAALRLSREETLSRLKKKYDGYHFGDRLTELFNPFSLLNCFETLSLRDFWFSSGTPTYLVRLLQHSDVQINELAGKYYDASQFVSYRADVEQPLPMIYQSGYLTIKDYDREFGVYLLDFPNEEVRTGFIDVLAAHYFHESTQPKSWVLEVTRALRLGNLPLFEKHLTALLASATYRFQRKHDERSCERHFQYTFYLIMQMLGFYNVVAEKESSEGRADCVVESADFVYVIEFKLNSTAQAALRQVVDKGYALPYAADTRRVFAVGINFSSAKGTVDGFEAMELHPK